MSLSSITETLQSYLARGEHVDDIAELLARLLPYYLEPELHTRYFKAWEAQGIHVTPVVFHSPLPNTHSLPDALWEREREDAGLELNEELQLHLLQNVFPRFHEEYNQFPLEATGDLHDFYLTNGTFEGTDALALYCMVRHFRPETILEVGTGHSTRLAARAAVRNDHTRLVAIAPYPDPALEGLPGLDSIIERAVQEVDLATFQQLQANDILFIDSSHVSKIGSDVNYLLLDVLPHLNPGVIVHFHDIFLPGEYPQSWVKEELRFWNEQYLLQAFLTFNSAFEVLLSNSYLGNHYRDVLQTTFPRSPWWGGGSFWIRRKDMGRGERVGGSDGV